MIIYEKSHPVVCVEGNANGLEAAEETAHESETHVDGEAPLGSFLADGHHLPVQHPGV